MLVAGAFILGTGSRLVNVFAGLGERAEQYACVERAIRKLFRARSRDVFARAAGHAYRRSGHRANVVVKEGKQINAVVTAPYDGPDRTVTSVATRVD
jgi:hypothetical protein